MASINTVEASAAFKTPPLKFMVPVPVPLVKLRALTRVPPSKLIVPSPP